MALSNQMEMFEDGGLKDEGGTIDPVSGNDVPSGSTQEEVRDDIPAQLSEGEFVFPADVTRFIGLEKLMQIRQEAKAGLKRMEDMGQMGNSEEATMPDDMPFDINDLDMEEEENNNNSQEMNKGGMVRVGGVEMPKPRIQGQQMAEGGVIKAATGTLVNQGTGVTSVPSQFAGQNLPSYNANQTLQTGVSPAYTIPTIPAVTRGYDPKFMTGQEMQTNQTAPSFETLIGKNPGQYDEMRTYKNDAGATLQIPFKNGQPIYPIPEGYIFVDSEEEQTETPTVQSVRPTTTQAQVDGGDNDSGTRVGTTMVGKTGKGITDKSLSVNQNTKSVMDALSQAKGASKLGRGLQTLAMAAMPFGLTQLSGITGAQSLGKPDPTALNDMISQQHTAMGTYSNMTPDEMDQNPMGNLNALSMQAYGMSLSDKAMELGMGTMEFAEVALTPGYAPGQVDPSHGGTYSVNGQATDSNGTVSYSSMADFGRAMNATSKTGYYGTEKDAENDPTNPLAIAFLNTLNANRARDSYGDKGFEIGDDKASKEAKDRGYTTGPISDMFGDDDAPSGAPSQSPSDQGLGSISTDEGIGTDTSTSDDGTNSNDANSSAGVDGPGGADSSDAGMGGEDVAKGSLITKRKASGKLKKKYMKRGGLASRK